jgi:hypothetical protein
MRTAFPIPGVLAFALLVGCGGRHQPTEPVERAPEACCTAGDMQLQKFAGCRVGGRRCGEREVYWMRGAVTCGPVDAGNCAGGRCCEYRPRYDPSIGAPPSEASIDETPADVDDEAEEPAATSPDSEG